MDPNAFEPHFERLSLSVSPSLGKLFLFCRVWSPPILSPSLVDCLRPIHPAFSVTMTSWSVALDSWLARPAYIVRTHIREGDRVGQAGCILMDSLIGGQKEGTDEWWDDGDNVVRLRC